MPKGWPKELDQATVALYLISGTQDVKSRLETVNDFIATFPDAPDGYLTRSDLYAYNRAELANSPAEQAAVRDFSEKIDIKNTDQVMNYGSAAQKNISEFSDAALSSVKTKDLGECGDMLSELVVELKGLNFDEEEKKGFLGLFKKASQTIAEKKAQFDKAEVNVDKIVEELEKHEITLMKDISMMDKMYEKNEEYMKELTMYILAGKLKIEHLRNVELPEYVAKAKETGLPEDARMILQTS